jgi:hypothetical protein
MLSLHNHGRNWWMFFFFQRCISYRISDFCFLVCDLLPWLQKSFMLGLAGSFPILAFVLSLAAFHVFARIISVQCLPQIQLYNDQIS